MRWIRNREGCRRGRAKTAGGALKFAAKEDPDSSLIEVTRARANERGTEGERKRRESRRSKWPIRKEERICSAKIERAA